MRSTRGFTLIELLVVIAIIGILIGMLKVGDQKASDAAGALPSGLTSGLKLDVQQEMNSLDQDVSIANDLLPAVQDGSIQAMGRLADLDGAFHRHDATLAMLDGETLSLISQAAQAKSPDGKQALIDLHRELVSVRTDVIRMKSQLDTLQSLLPQIPPPCSPDQLVCP